MKQVNIQPMAGSNSSWKESVEKKLYQSIKPKSYKSSFNLVKSIRNNPQMGLFVRYLNISEDTFNVVAADGKSEATAGNLFGELLLFTSKLETLRLTGEEFMLFNNKSHKKLRNQPILSEAKHLYFTTQRASPDSIISLLEAAPNVETLILSFELYQN